MEKDYQKQWQKCLEIIRDNLGQSRFDTWFACAKALSYEDNKLTLGLPSSFFYEKYEDDFYDILSSALKRVFGPEIKLIYNVGVIGDGLKEEEVTIPSPKKSHAVGSKFIQSLQSSRPMESNGSVKSEEIDPQLNPSLNFENYCVGESNRLPFTIAEFIANHPDKSDFNPFFLYGDVGVGKTHLIQAIGIRIKERNPRAKVLFITLRQFQNLMASATIRKEIPGFLNWFQQIDALLIDDLQELTFKDGTAKVLFPIFNHLHQHGKKLVFTCDRPPVELDGIADRLIDRFKWGITERLPRPDKELRKKILQFKAAKNGLSLPEEVIDVVAEKCTGSVRELEGIVMGLLTRSITLNVPINSQLAEEVMKNSIKTVVKKSINFEMIVEATAEHYNLNPDVIFSKSRVRDIADARQMIMYLSHKHTDLSSTAIGMKLNRKHATVLHGISAVADRLPIAKDLSNAVDAIETVLMR